MKKTYITPMAEIFESEVEDFMVKASVAIGEVYNGMTIDAKKNNLMSLDDSYDDWESDDETISENSLGCDFGSAW